jgi:GxxExxY protein
MPIHCPIHFEPISDEQFRRLDYRVMVHVFACHNELGRLCDEAIYQADLKARLEADGFSPVAIEVPVTLTWKNFRKVYYLDLVVLGAILYELKTVARLTGEHKAQLLNYLLLLGLLAGKLVNFRPPSVEWQFANTQLTPQTRREFRSDTRRWREPSPACPTLRLVLLELLTDWGAFLDLSLYQEALTFFLGGEQQGVQPVTIVRDGLHLGTQKCHPLAPDLAFKLTAHTENLDRAEAHLRRFLAHTNLRAIQWLNLNHARIEFVTLTR